MTEVELVESVSYSLDLAVSTLSLYMTVTSAYLIVAFLAGVRLTRSQISIISALYIFISVITTLTFYGLAIRATHYAYKLEALDTGAPIYANDIGPVVLAITLAGGILASLKFMWDARHLKTE